MSGLEVLGIVGNIIQVADLGARVALRLCTFCHKVKQVETNIQTLSKDVSLTCTVLRQLGDNLQQDDQIKLYSKDAFLTANAVLEECDKVFRELDSAIDKNLASFAAGAPSEMRNPFLKLSRKVNYVFKEPGLGVLQSNLDRLKNTMLLMLNVIIYAEQLRRRETEKSKQDQHEIIEILARQKKDSDDKFERLSRAIQGVVINESPKITTRAQFTVNTTAFSEDTPTAVLASSDPERCMPQRLPRLAQLDVVPEDLHGLFKEEIRQYAKLITNILEGIQKAKSVLAESRYLRMHQSIENMHTREEQYFNTDYGWRAGQYFEETCPPTRRWMNDFEFSKLSAVSQNPNVAAEQADDLSAAHRRNHVLSAAGPTAAPQFFDASYDSSDNIKDYSEILRSEENHSVLFRRRKRRSSSERDPIKPAQSSSVVVPKNSLYSATEGRGPSQGVPILPPPIPSWTISASRPQGHMGTNAVAETAMLNSQTQTNVLTSHGVNTLGGQARSRPNKMQKLAPILPTPAELTQDADEIALNSI